MKANFKSLLRFELGYQLNTWAAPLFACCYFAFAFLMGSQGTSPVGVNYNSEYELFLKMGLLSLGAVFSIMFFVVSAIHRDRKYAMEPLIFSTPVSKSMFYFSRLTGAWLMALGVLIFAIPGFFLGVYFSDLDPERIGPFSILSAGSVFWILFIPSVSICTALIFTVGLHSRNTLATYAMAILIYGAYFISSIFLNSPLIANAAPISSENLFFAALLDPFGLSAFFEQTNLWTPYQKNSTPIAFSGLLAWNRVLWMVGALLVIMISYMNFSFRKPHVGSIQKAKADSASETSREIFQKVTPSLGHFYPVIPSSVKLEFLWVFKSIPFWLITGGWTLIASTEIYSKIYSGGSYGESYFPEAQILLEQVQSPLNVFCLVLLVFFTGELVWRARESKFHEILGATPAPTGYFFISTTFTLLAMLGIMIGVTLVICLGFQLIQNQQSIDTISLLILILSPGLSLFVHTVIMLQIHQWSRNKYLGMCLSALVIALFSSSLGSAVGINHPLLKIGTSPYLVYSQQAGYGLGAKGFWLLNLLWMNLAVIISICLFRNWKGSSTRKLQKTTRLTFSKLVFPSILLISLASYSFYQINIVGNYKTANTRLNEQHQYELAYKKYEASPVPAYSSLDMEVDLYPSKNTFNAKVKGFLKNTSEKSIDSFLMTEKVDLEGLQIERAGTIEKDEILRVNLVQLDTPLQPGEEVAFSFEVKLKSAVFRQEKSLVQDGTYLNFRDFAPYFGYAETREISDNLERKKRNLPIKSSRTYSQDHPELERTLIKVDFKARVSTESPQTVITSGKLKGMKNNGDRVSFDFESPHKIMPAVAFFSGNYQETSVQFNGVNLQVFSIPEHHESAMNTLDIMRKTLEFASNHFGRYPLDHLKIVEVPSYWEFGGFAHPGVISMVEDNFFLVKPEPLNPLDLRTKRTVHEVAHQWFGHLLAPRNLPGASIFVEGLAKYTEAVLLEQEFGKAALWQLTDQANTAYFSGRAFATEPEPALSHTEGQNYLAYGKSLLGLLTVRDLVGEEKLNGAIRNMVDISMENSEPKVTMADFLRMLKSNSSPDQIRGITEAFEKVVRFDLSITTAEIEQVENGKYKVTVGFQARKMETRADGSEFEIPINDKLEVTAFSAHPKTLTSTKDILYSEFITIREGEGAISFLTDQSPSFIGLDPWGTKPDSNRKDNFFKMDE